MKKIILLIESILPYLTVFIATLYRPIDPDLGWHLKYGEYFFKYGRVLRENTFSTQMRDFVWANISWGADLIYYIFYRFGSFLGLTLGSALVVTATFYFFAKAFKLDYWEKAIIFPIILYFTSPVNQNSFRGQQLSLLLFSVIIYLLNRYEEKKDNTLYVLPLLFLVWANIHGLFIVGLAVFGLWAGFYLLSDYFRSKKIPLNNFKLFSVIILLSLLATLIHPYGIHIYEDAFLHLGDPLLKRIAEYLPAQELSMQWMNLIYTAILAGIGLVSYLFNNVWAKKIPQIGVFTVLYLLSTWVRRYSWVMYYLVIPFLKPLAGFIRPDSKKGAFSGATLLFSIYIVVLFMLKQPFRQYPEMDWNEYCRIFNRCSTKAARVLQKYYIEGKTMTLYNWGGWLIWNYPEMKPSTDGRMHLWRDEKGNSAFEHDYRIEQNISDIDNSKYDVVFTAVFKPVSKRLSRLADEKKWRLVYKDDTTVIFVRILPI